MLLSLKLDFIYYSLIFQRSVSKQNTKQKQLIFKKKISFLQSYYPFVSTKVNES